MVNKSFIVGQAGGGLPTARWPEPGGCDVRLPAMTNEGGLFRRQCSAYTEE